MTPEDEIKELLKLILRNRHKCFIPEEKDLIGWTERATELLKEGYLITENQR